MKCQLLEFDPNPRGPAPEPRVHFETVTDARGGCRSRQLPEGLYTLRLRVDAGRSFVDRSVTLRAGEETGVDVALHPIHVSGECASGLEAGACLSPDAERHQRDQAQCHAPGRPGQAKTDEEGRYATILWSAGDYVALLESPAGTPAAARRLRIDGDDDHLDFNLEDHGVGGAVVEERGQPVPEATVYLTWAQTSHRMASTGPEGSFFFPVDAPGEGTVRVLKSGYLSPEPVAVAVRAGTPAQPLTLKMRRASRIAGQIVSSRGPARSAAIQSYRIEPGGGASFLGMTLAKADGSFEVAAADNASTRLFITGAGCPLSVFDVRPPTGDLLVLRCPALPASLELTLADAQGRPLAGRTILVRRDGAFIPAGALIEHLGRFRVPAATDGSGRLFLVGMAPGSYDLYLADSTSPELIFLGVKEGYLTSAFWRRSPRPSSGYRRIARGAVAR